MRNWILAGVLVGAVLASFIYSKRTSRVPSSSAVPVESATGGRGNATAEGGDGNAFQTSKASGSRRQNRAPVMHSAESSVSGNTPLDQLLSAAESFSRKQGVWKQLKDTGQLEAAVTDLEQRWATDPRAADVASVLGQAYLQKCTLTQDVRDQGILAMKADQLFDSALSLDPSNWEARFMKAVALSHWPDQLKKGDQVIEHFQTLVDQQEAQSPQPQFSQTYLRLGEQLEKSGRPNDAAEIWRRGAALFPENSDLKTKLETVSARRL
jgi:tetratricopeptide (TPR) repeat protein